MNRSAKSRGRGERGSTMIEVLITMVILSFGLLGVAGLQARMQLAEVEAYQRTHGIVLLQDMVDRVNANRGNAMGYITGAPLGTGSPVQDCTGLAGAALDLCEWSNALLGAAESTAGGQKVGAMNGARGCITNISAAMPREFVVAVVWQGIVPTVAPASTTCGQNLYGNEQTRRAMVARVTIGCLQNDPTTGLCVTP
ncbi:MAG: prepilin-type N-terminal cleavage/methylation domain-containing protein [Betaproteobacteria bacterium]|nr:prepilin-type N-terminal cleavage/methylation domain-containing protein [Betaproteobacteria bacterium]